MPTRSPVAAIGRGLGRSRLVARSRRRVLRRLADRVRETPPAELEASLDGFSGRATIATMFRLMPLQLDRRSAKGVNVAVEWRIKEADGGASMHTVVIAGGRCRVRRGVVAEPDLVLEMAAIDFLRLAAGEAAGPELVMTGRLVVRGDLDLALRLPRLFRVPRAA